MNGFGCLNVQQTTMKRDSSDFLTVPLSLLGISLILLVVGFGLNTLVYAFVDSMGPQEEVFQSAFDAAIGTATLASK